MPSERPQSRVFPPEMVHYVMKAIVFMAVGIVFDLLTGPAIFEGVALFDIGSFTFSLGMLLTSILLGAWTIREEWYK